MKQRSMLVLGLAAVLLATTSVAGAATIKGTIQGLLMTLHGEKCIAGTEHVVAEVENQFVLVDEDDNWYALPQLKASQVAPYLNEKVRIEGEVIGDGRGVKVRKAYTFEHGEWKKFYDREDYKWRKELEKAILNRPV